MKADSLTDYSLDQLRGMEEQLREDLKDLVEKTPKASSRFAIAKTEFRRAESSLERLKNRKANIDRLLKLVIAEQTRKIEIA